MTTTELKKALIHRITEIDDESFLNAIKTILETKSKSQILSLTDEQAAMLDAVNKAFEKAYYDAHDIYHGNAELAKEYWNKFDAERKAALRTVFNEQQYAQYLQLVAQITQPEAEKKN